MLILHVQKVDMFLIKNMFLLNIFSWERESFSWNSSCRDLSQLICKRYKYLFGTLFTCQEPDLNLWHDALPTKLSRLFLAHYTSEVLVSMEIM